MFLNDEDYYQLMITANDFFSYCQYRLNFNDCFINNEKTMGQHESVSRFYENIIGRSEAFSEKLFPVLTELFPEQTAGYTAHDLYLAVETLDGAVKTMDTAASHLEQAQYTRDAVVPAMDAVRAHADALETIVGARHWPLPTYQELLTSI